MSPDLGEQIMKIPEKNFREVCRKRSLERDDLSACKSEDYIDE